MNLRVLGAWTRAKERDENQPTSSHILELIREGNADKVKAAMTPGASMVLSGILIPTVAGGLKIFNTTPIAFATLMGNNDVLGAVLTDPLADPRKGNGKEELLCGLSPYAAAERAKLTEAKTLFDAHDRRKAQAMVAATSYTRSLLERFIN